MIYHIDPKIDCVFKALLGSDENRNLLIHFLNAILNEDLSAPIIWVEILNPYNEREFIGDKLSIVDIKARDSQDQLYQVEIQLQVYSNLPERIIYTWADIYSNQLKSGEDYQKLQPTYSIWLMGENLIKTDDRYAHEFKLRDENGQILREHGGIWILELNKFKDELIENNRQVWLKLIKDGDKLDDDALPDGMNTQEMRQAMSTLRSFSEKEKNYHIYQARQNFLREQRTIQREFEQNLQQERLQRQAAIQEKLAALRREETERKEKEAAMQREDAAIQREETERKEKEAAMQREEAAMQREEAERKEKEAALQELEQLKTLLGQP